MTLARLAPAERSRLLSTLGLKNDVSEERLRTVYLRLAKKWHPDVSRRPEASARFQELAEAYRALSRPAGMDLGIKPGPVPVPGQGLARLRCSACGKASDSLRHARFTGIISFLLLSWRHKIEGIFCPPCARAAALKANAISGFLGWWSVPGAVLTPLAIVRNARGGESSETVNLGLLCHNFLVYQARGDLDAARSVANLIVRSPRGVALRISVAIAALERKESAEPALAAPKPRRPRAKPANRAANG